jgi:hypothetical protein
MCDFLLTFSMLLSLVGLSIVLCSLIGSHVRATCGMREPGDPSPDAEVYGQNLVETYLGYRQ